MQTGMGPAGTIAAITEVTNLGEKTQFEPGDEAPNDGHYMEIGERAFPMGINDPQIITLKKGETFPETTNHNRKWKRKQH